MNGARDYLERRERLAEQVRGARGVVGLNKRTSNLFRDRERPKRFVDARDFDHVLGVDAEGLTLDAEGMITYERLADAALEHGLMPAVVPELKTITLGGAAAGVGIEASSFKYGLVHETLREIEVLTGAGEILVCTPDNAHADLFFGFPNSYGTLGYALRLSAQAVPVKPYVRLERVKHASGDAFFEALADACAADADFVDGVAFAPDALYLNVCRFVERAAHVSDYTFEHVYYRSIRDKAVDHLTARDFIWRWDTDWFWCSKNLGAQIPLVRRLYGRDRLGSRTYQRIMRWNSRWGLTRAFDRLRRLHREPVIQDVDVPIEHAAAFLDFFQREIGITPVWICPVRASANAARFTLFPMKPRALYVNFGFWDVVRSARAHEHGYFNRMIEHEVSALGGIKSLYSESFFGRTEFDAIYGGVAYRELKAKYDPRGVFPDLYSKCVLRA